jgi:hypothetical protein
VRAPFNLPYGEFRKLSQRARLAPTEKAARSGRPTRCQSRNAPSTAARLSSESGRSARSLGASSRGHHRIAARVKGEGFACSWIVPLASNDRSQARIPRPAKYSNRLASSCLRCLRTRGEPVSGSTTRRTSSNGGSLTHRAAINHPSLDTWGQGGDLKCQVLMS